MSILDSLLGQVGGGTNVQDIAGKVGLSPDQVEQAVTALGQAHGQDGDTVATAAENTGISPDTLNQIVGHLGGEGALGSLSSLLGQGGDSGGAGGLLGGLSKFLG